MTEFNLDENDYPYPISCKISCNAMAPVIDTIVFCHGSDKWVMKIVKEKGILFNREHYPDLCPDDFAKAVIDILEKSFDVKFERKIE